MRRLRRALDLYLHSALTWRCCWTIAGHRPRTRIVARNGLLYIEPN